MDGLAVAKQARVDLAELVLDPAHPFRVQAAPRVGAGWGDLDDAGRVPLARALLGRMDEKAWRSFFDVSVDGRMTAEPDPLKRWADPPWIWWRLVLDDEWDRRVAAERARVAAIPPVQASLDAEMTRRGTEREKLLAILRAAGPAGVLNSDLEASEVGRRYSSRVHELRLEGHVIDTVREGARAFRFILQAREKAA
jgi:hypothetical protein